MLSEPVHWFPWRTQHLLPQAVHHSLLTSLKWPLGRNHSLDTCRNSRIWASLRIVQASPALCLSFLNSSHFWYIDGAETSGTEGEGSSWRTPQNRRPCPLLVLQAAIHRLYVCMCVCVLLLLLWACTTRQRLYNELQVVPVISKLKYYCVCK